MRCRERFAPDGTPVRRVTYIENGILKEFGYDRYWAQKPGKTATGGGERFGAGAVKFVGGTRTTAELIESTKRGILVTHFFYIRPLDQRTVMPSLKAPDFNFLSLSDAV